MRKTIEVAKVRRVVNNLLKGSVYLRAPGKVRDMTPDEAYRMGAAVILEYILMETGNYKGFGYQEGVIDFSVDPPDAIGDETRRIYY